MLPQQLLIIDDEPDILEGLKRLLGYEMPDVEVTVSSSAVEALELLKQKHFDLVLVDIRMPEMDGLEFLSTLKEKDSWTSVIMMTAYGSIETAVDAIKRGAYDFITKPFEIPDLLRLLRKGLERSELVRENLHLRKCVQEKTAFENFVGESPPLKRLFDAIQALAHTDYTVLIRGESGTGKELVARAIHSLSKRQSRPFVAVNCPAIPEHLLESELFGHRRGAFTGADRDHEGLFEEAHGSSLLLDEIGDIPVSVQTKLLRVLQEQEIRPLGSQKTKKVDVRILATTNQDLEAKIRDRSFREDLYYRLNVVTLRTPGLSEIREDIPLLVDHFARKVCAELNLSPVRRFSPEALEMLLTRPWPGNVRELQNVVRRMVIFAPECEIRDTDIQRVEDRFQAAVKIEKDYRDEPFESYVEARDRLLARFTQSYISDLLHHTGGNVTRAAEIAGLNRASIQKIMRRMGLRSEEFKT